MKKPFILFHWSPSSRRKSIMRRGLRVGRPHVTHSDGWRAGYLCFSASPSLAWVLSAKAVNAPGEWDLWMTWSCGFEKPLRRIRWTGPEVKEFRTKENVPKGRLWFVGTRYCDPRKRK